MNRIVLFRDFSNFGISLERATKEAVLRIARNYGLKVQFTSVVLPALDGDLVDLKVNGNTLYLDHSRNFTTDEIEEILLKALSGEDLFDILKKQYMAISSEAT